VELLDGNNLLGRFRGERSALVAVVAELARRKRRRVVVVFDGPPEAGRAKVQALGDVTLVCAAPLSADDEILRRVREARDPKSVTVVTDDRALATPVAASGARVVGLEAYRVDGRKRIESAPAREAEKSVPPVGLKDWERWFSDPKNRLT
jgi:predicted RNA-binding protein with PIN domain